MARDSDQIDDTVGDAIDRWEIQLRKGVLEFVILLSLRDREQYGFELIGGIARRAALDVPEGTLYPLLLRLAKDALVTSRLGAGEGGAPRKYYTLTPRGRAVLDPMIVSWARITASVEHMLQGATA